jgi:hypothetical protein
MAPREFPAGSRARSRVGWFAGQVGIVLESPSLKRTWRLLVIANESYAVRVRDLEEVSVQTPACDRCTQGVMDSTNDHLYGRCQCECHDVVPRERHLTMGEELRG